MSATPRMIEIADNLDRYCVGCDSIRSEHHHEATKDYIDWCWVCNDARKPLPLILKKIVLEWRMSTGVVR